MLKYIIIMVLLIIGAYLIVQGVGCKKAIREGKIRLEEYGAENIELCYGNMSYADKGDGDKDTAGDLPCEERFRSRSPVDVVVDDAQSL